ncbi:MAG: hypothetical protein WBQ50_01685 [Nocardioides sp.]
MDAESVVDLPYIDAHDVSIAAPRDLVWTTLQRQLSSVSGGQAGNPFTRLLGTDPPGGFEVVEAVVSERLTLVGRHRFSRYRLVFELGDAHDGATHVRAETYARFPGLHGRVYRTLVIGSRAHVLATTHLLRTLRRLSLEAAAAPPAPSDPL